jgi:hypothetical protein
MVVSSIRACLLTLTLGWYWLGGEFVGIGCGGGGILAMVDGSF